MTEYITDFQQSIFDTLSRSIENPKSYYNNLTKTMIVLLSLFFLYWLTIRIINRSELTDFKRNRIKRRIKNSFFLLLIIAISIIWVNALNSLVIIIFLLGLFGIVLIRGILDNILGWFIIRKRRYFKLNQRIEINDKIGRVISLGVFHFELAEMSNWLSSETYTGRKIKIPNKTVFDAELFVYDDSMQLIRQEVSYLIRHDNNWQDAKEIILNAVTNYYDTEFLKNIDSELLKKNKIEMEPVFNISLDENGITLFCQFTVDYSNISKVKSEIHEKVLEGFNQHDNIEFAVLEVKRVD